LIILRGRNEMTLEIGVHITHLGISLGVKHGHGEEAEKAGAARMM
jgi:hypothetical protein